MQNSRQNQKMSLRDRIGSLKAAFTGSPDGSLLRMVQAFAPMYGEPPRRSTQDWITLYNKSPRMNPVHQIASDVATSAYGIYQKNDTRKIKPISGAASDLLKKPCPDETMTEYSLFYVTQVYLLLPSGEAFWIKERNGLGAVTELWVVPPGWVMSIPSRTQPYFAIYPQGNMTASPIYVQARDMVYFKKPDVNNPYLRGIGRAEGIGDEIETDEYMAKYSKRFFWNDAIPSMVGMMPGADENTINRTEEAWQQKYGGYNNSHKMAWLNWDAKFQILKENAKDMDFIESRRYLRDTANQHFSIPPELFGILENSNRSTIDAAYYLYTKNVLRKELKFIDDTLNAQLIPEFGAKIYLEHDNVVPEDEEFKLKKASEGLKNGGLTVDEWRQANGWEALPGNKGQVLYTPLNMMPTSLTGEPPPTPPARPEPPQPPEGEAEPPKKPEPPAEGEPEKGRKDKELTGGQKERIWQVLDKSAVKNERAFISALKKYFQGQQERINASLAKGMKAETDNPDELTDWEKEAAILLAVLTPLWIASFKEGFQTVDVLFDFGMGEAAADARSIWWVKNFGAEQVKGINDTTKEQLRKTLAEGIANGESTPKLRDRVSGAMTDAKTWRAERIARTETHNTVGWGSLEAYKAAGVQQKEWLTAVDGRERDSHGHIKGQVVGIDEKFSNGLRCPGDPAGRAQEIINCRCGLLPVIPKT